MKKRKLFRAISLLLAIVIIFSSLSVLSYAEYFTEPISFLNLSDYTVDSLLKVSYQDWQKYLNAYKEKNNISCAGEANSIDASIQWTSTGDENNPGTHEYITFLAMSIMMSEKGNWEGTFAELLDEISIVSIASAKPDKNTIIFAGHFYDPDTEKNYLQATSPTCKTWAVSHYNSAISKEQKNKHADALDEIGRALHFLQDACEPHHAANITATNPSHSAFETYVNNSVDNLSLVSSVSNSMYQTAYNNDVGYFVRLSAWVAKPYINSVNNKDNTSNWFSTAQSCVNLAVTRSAALLYKFERESGLI